MYAPVESSVCSAVWIGQRKDQYDVALGNA